MSDRQGKGQGFKENAKPDVYETEEVVIKNVVPYVFFPTKPIRAKWEENRLTVEDRTYELKEPTIKEKVIAVIPFILFGTLPLLLTDPVPDSVKGVISSIIGAVAGTLYGAFYTLGFVLLFLALLTGYDYRFGIVAFLVSFSITGTVLFLTRAKKAKEGVYVMLPPVLFRRKRKATQSLQIPD